MTPHKQERQQLPGINPVRRALYNKQDGRCAACSRRCQLNTSDGHTKPYTFTVDHILPFSLGGKDHAANRIGLCFTCNQKKGGKMPTPKLWGKLQKAARGVTQ